MLSLSVEEIDEAGADDDDQGEDLGVCEVILSEKITCIENSALFLMNTLGCSTFLVKRKMELSRKLDCGIVS